MSGIMTDIKSMTIEELKELMTELGDKPFRAKQIYSWLHEHLVTSYEEMTNLPKVLREKLLAYPITALEVMEVQTSRIDGTQKYLFRLSDGNVIESVLMRYKHGNSVCISSQVGCRMGCRFCASTIGGLTRNLKPSEMLDQIYRIQVLSGERVSNVVVMGTGEPLDNYENLLRFIHILTEEGGLHLSQRNLTVSTCGLVPRMYELAEEKLSMTLALSLHAPNDQKRQELMPIARKYTMDEVLLACKNYFEKTGRRITFEYSLVAGVNDSDEDARELAGRAVILRDRKSVAYTGTDFAAVNADGSVTVFSENPVFQAAASWKGIVSLSAGKEHLVGLRSDGTVVAAGTNVYGECNVSEFSDIVSIDTGPYHTVGLRADGTVIAVGYSNTLNRVCDVQEWEGIVSIAASATQTMGLTADGSLVTTAEETSLSEKEHYYDIDCTGVTYEAGLTRDQKAVLSSGAEFAADSVFVACAQDIGYAVGSSHRVVTSGLANPFLEMQNVREILVSETGDVFCVTSEGTVRCGSKVNFQQQIETLTGVGIQE